jgi:hypothetical protein
MTGKELLLHHILFSGKQRLTKSEPFASPAMKQTACDEVNSPSIYQYLTCDKAFVKQSFFLRGGKKHGRVICPATRAAHAQSRIISCLIT